MNDKAPVLSPISTVAALGGFLEGLSFLNRDQRSNFAATFTITASHDDAVLAELRSQFSHLLKLTLKYDKSFDGGFGQLEHDIRKYILVYPYVNDEQRARNAITLIIQDHGSA